MEGTADRIDARVAQLAAAGATAAELAVAAAEDWRAIEAALAPIVGNRGFAAIVYRSLHLLQTPQSPAIEPDGDPIDLWQQALAAQSAASAADASGRLLRVFCDLLATLIGGSLTERLLRPVWDAPRIGADAQDTTP